MPPPSELGSSTESDQSAARQRNLEEYTRQLEQDISSAREWTPEQAMEVLGRFAEKDLMGSYDESRFLRSGSEEWTEREIKELKEGAEQEIERLRKEVLPPLWEKICQLYPQCAGFPAEELWRLAVDGKNQCPTFKPIPFPEEPGFLVGTLRMQALVYKALLLGLKLTEPLYKRMWEMATKNLVVEVGVGEEKKIFPSGYRQEIGVSSSTSFLGIQGDNYSKAGIKAFNQKYAQSASEKDPELQIIKGGNFSDWGQKRKKKEYCLKKRSSYECQKAAAQNINRFYKKAEIIKNTMRDEKERQNANLNLINEEVQNFAQDHPFPDGNSRLHTFGVLLFWSLKNGFAQPILWNSMIFDGMHPREIQGEEDYGRETFAAYCRGVDPETCHDTPERLAQVKRFEQLPAKKQGFLRHATANGCLDTTLFIQLEKDPNCPAKLRNCITRLFADLPYHRKDPKAAMMDLYDIHDLANNNSACQEYRKKIREVFQELKRDREEYRQRKTERLSKISIDGDLRKKYAAEDADPLLSEIIPKFDSMKEIYSRIWDNIDEYPITEKYAKKCLECLRRARDQAKQILEEGLSSETEEDLKYFHDNYNKFIDIKNKYKRE